MAAYYISDTTALYRVITQAVIYIYTPLLLTVTFPETLELK